MRTYEIKFIFKDESEKDYIIEAVDLFEAHLEYKRLSLEVDESQLLRIELCRIIK